MTDPSTWTRWERLAEWLFSLVLWYERLIAWKMGRVKLRQGTAPLYAFEHRRCVPMGLLGIQLEPIHYGRAHKVSHMAWVLAFWLWWPLLKRSKEVQLVLTKDQYMNEEDDHDRVHN